MSDESISVVVKAAVVSVERVSPTFARVTLGGEDLDHVLTPGRTYDQRVKLIFPPEGGALPELDGASDTWYHDWLAVPEELRGAMRTYSIRDVDVTAMGTTVAIDFVLHLEPGFTGPAGRWASEAQVGDELLMVAPRRGKDNAGVEFDPGAARELVFAGDETAAPAIARILEDLPADAVGAAFIEVPHGADALHIEAPAGIHVRWIAREGKAHGESLMSEVAGYLGAGAVPTIVADGSEELLWETPRFSSTGEALDSTTATNASECYLWFAGESSVVTGLRRHVVKECGFDRSQVAFMGYWKRGVAMRG